MSIIKKNMELFLLLITDPHMRKKLSEKDNETMQKAVALALKAYPELDYENIEIKPYNLIYVHIVMFINSSFEEEFYVKKNLRFDWEELSFFCRTCLPQVKLLFDASKIKKQDANVILYDYFKHAVFTLDGNDYIIRGILGFAMFRAGFFTSKVVEENESLVNQLINRKPDGTIPTDIIKSKAKLIKFFAENTKLD
jgi:hypothetical protein